MQNIEDVLIEEFDREAMSAEHRSRIFQYLDIVGARDRSTREHSIRVGIYATRVARTATDLCIRPKTILWAGLLHDIGKALVDPDLFTKAGFGEDDHERMERHVEFGWRLLRNVHEVTAHIIVRHHWFGPRRYPATLPRLPAFLKDQEGMINRAARIVALADYFDSVMTRNDGKFGGPLSFGERRKKFFEANKDMQELIVRLEEKGVFPFMCVS